MDPNVQLNNTACEDKLVSDRKRYLSMVGSLMYAALGTRPDLSYCVTALSRYNSTPLQMHVTAAKRALRYLKGTADYRLYYPRGGKTTETKDFIARARIQGFTDSDWAGNELTRKSVGGCVFYTHILQEHSNQDTLSVGAFHWQSRTQTVVARSTPEAEYIACSDAVREAIWVRKLLQDMLEATPTKLTEPDGPAAVQIGCDNQGALKLIETGISKQKTKHIDIKYHHVRDEEAKGSARYHYVKTTDNPNDLLTKALPTPRHRMLASLMGLRPRLAQQDGTLGI